MASPKRSIHVVAAVIIDTRGRILLNQRTENRDMGGLWEFPGGKREPGETSAQALARELREELGIEAEIGPWLMDVPQIYPDKHLRLEVLQVTSWKGTPRGREGQAITWVSPDKLGRYSMPPADLPVVALLRQPDRYLVTPLPDAVSGGDGVWLDRIGHAIEAGVTRIQLRLQGYPTRDALIEQAIARHGRKVQWLVNRDHALATRLGIGLHLGSEQLAALQERPVLAKGEVLAASCHDLAELQAAQRLGCDCAVLGPVQATASHPDAAPMGWEGFEALREQVSMPLYALGGLGAQDLEQARRSGAHGIAAIRGLWPA